jgi:capsule polysaccharide export protein KpsE/RkpR
MTDQKETDNIDLKYLISIALNKKKIIFIASFTALIVSLILVLFVIDPIFYSAGVVKTSSQSSGLQNLLGLSSGGLDIGDISSLSGGGGATKELALYTQILLSRRAVEAAIIKYNIMESENFKYMFDAVKFFRKEIIELVPDKQAGTLEIGIYDKDPVKAKEMADFMIAQLNQINIEMNVLNAKNNREFLEARYVNVSADLKNVEDSLIIFQNKFGVSPELSVQASLKVEIEIESEIKSEELKLELMRKILSPGEPEIKTQEDKISALKKQYELIHSTPSEYENTLGLKGSPELVMNFLRIRREVEIQNKILTTIIPILEQSKIEEKRETPTVIILDSPNIPDKKAKPKRAYIVVGLTFLSGFLTFIFFIVKDKWKEFKGSYNI